jgi:hypothetical protein
MAVTTVTTSMAAGVNYTRVTDTSADWASVPNSTYFYDKADKLVHYKDSTGTVQEIFSGSGITVGTTAVTSGTDGRVFFQAGGVVQQDGAFNWDNTNKRLGIGANATSPSAALNIRTNTIVANDVLTLQNGQYGNTIFRIRDNATASESTMGSFFITGLIHGGNSGVTRRFDLGGFGLGSYGDSGANAVWENNQGNIGDGLGTSVISVSSNFYVNLQTTKKYKFEAVTGNFGIGNVGTLGARLDVRAQGALSTDIVIRARNSADTADIFSIRGNNNIYLAEGTFNGSNTIFHGSTSLLQYSHNANSSIALGQGAAFTNATNYNTIVGASSTTGATVGFGIALGYSVFVTATGAIGIGDRARAGGVNSIRIGNSDGGSSAYTGTNSIHLGKTISGNSITADDVLMTYFNSQSSSTLTRANGSFGLLGQQSYIIGNGGGTYGIETFMGNGGNTLVVTNHPSVPSTNILNTFQLYSNDITAGNAAPHFRTENGSIVKLYQETTGVAAATLVGGGGTTITDTDTFGGYTLQQIAQALKNLGILA